MAKLDSAIREVHKLDTLSSRDQWVNHIHPLVKLLLTLFYIIVVMSFSKYDLMSLSGMLLYPIALFILAELSFSEAVKRLKVVLPLVCFVGIFNPIFEHTPVLIFGIPATLGFLSMLTLILKGILAVFASYLLIATTPMEQICFSLQLLHVPSVLITVFLLIYRYITLLLKETNRMVKAYSLRAPGQKGIHFRAWGSLAGLLLLRSMDRAQVVYQAMALRGYQGDFSFYRDGIRWQRGDILYLLFWGILIFAFRCMPIFSLVGRLFLSI